MSDIIVHVKKTERSAERQILHEEFIRSDVSQPYITVEIFHANNDFDMIRIPRHLSDTLIKALQKC